MGRFFLVLLLFLSFTALSCEDLIIGPGDPKPPLPAIHSSGLATLIDSLRYALDFPALAVAIVTDTAIIDAQAIGCRRYGGEMNVTVNDQFHLGSNTKAVTAVLIGMLIDEGLLSWDMTLSEIFPEYSGSIRSEYGEVTILNLLSHSSGFMRDPDRTFTEGSPRNQRAEAAEWALSQPPAVSRGTYTYSNLGYIMLGAIAEKVTNRQYEELLIEKVLLPLGITAAGFGPMGTPGREDEPLQHTNSHSAVEPVRDADNDPVYSPAGRLHMTITGWAKFNEWVLAAEAGHQSLISIGTAHKLTSSIVPMGGGIYYACGWMILNQDWAGGRSIQHSGSNGFNYSEASLAPGRKFGIIAAVNQGPGEQADPLYPVIRKLIDYYYHELQRR